MRFRAIVLACLCVFASVGAFAADARAKLIKVVGIPLDFIFLA